MAMLNHQMVYLDAQHILVHVLTYVDIPWHTHLFSYIEVNVGKTITNLSPNHHFLSWYKPFPNGWSMALFYPMQLRSPMNNFSASSVPSPTTQVVTGVEARVQVLKSEFQQLHYIVCLLFFVCVQPKGWSLKRKFWSKHHFRCELWCGKLSVQLGVNKSKHKGTGRFKTTMHISETLHFDILDMKLNRTVIYIYCILYLAFLFHGFLLETWRPPP